MEESATRLVNGDDTLVTDGKTLRGSIDQKPGAAATLLVQADALHRNRQVFSC